MAEIIREKALDLLDEEVPHGIAVEVEKMKKEQSRLQCELDNTKPSETEKRFYNDLQRQLLQTKEYLDKEGEKYTLLPQDFLVADITRVFDQIPIPGRRGRAR